MSKKKELTPVTNELNIGDSGFYIVRTLNGFSNRFMSFETFDVAQISENIHIVKIEYKTKQDGGRKIVYTLDNNVELGVDEAFRTKEHALQHAKELNKQMVYERLYAFKTMKKMIDGLVKSEMLEIDEDVASSLAQLIESVEKA